jgi:hypothetical protein
MQFLALQFRTRSPKIFHFKEWYLPQSCESEAFAELTSLCEHTQVIYPGVPFLCLPCTQAFNQ